MLREANISITKAIEEIDGEGKFGKDSWMRDTRGGGNSRVLVWEKVGVNLSVVHGKMPVSALRAATERGVNRGEGDQVPFFATGLSCVMHPRNPHCPTMHFNYRVICCFWQQNVKCEHEFCGFSRMNQSHPNILTIKLCSVRG
jgi:coproporphyrinogen III oxidase